MVSRNEPTAETAEVERAIGSFREAISSVTGPEASNADPVADLPGGWLPGKDVESPPSGFEASAGSIRT
jgi:hypothetical protein